MSNTNRERFSANFIHNSRRSRYGSDVGSRYVEKTSMLY